MDCRVILMVIFFFDVSCHELITGNPGICTINKLGNTISCCHNYHKNGNLCMACPPGTFGSNCTESCPNGYYGHFCKKKCKCRQCDKVNGCPMVTGEINIKTEVIYIASLGALTLVVCLLIGYINWKKCSVTRTPGIYLQPFGRNETPAAQQNDYDSPHRHKYEQPCTA